MQTAPPRSIRWLLVFALCALAAGGVSLWIGKDANWDLKNYHFYNAHSFVTGRLAWDIGPAQIQGFFNPLGDLPFYFLATHLRSPVAVALVMSLWAAAGAFFLVRICALFFPPPLAGRGACLAAAIAIGATGAVGIAMVSSTMNEWQSSTFIMASLYLLLKDAIQPQDTSLRRAALAGLLAGVGAGLKLTYATFALGLLVASVASIPGAARSRRFIVFGLALFAGIMLSYGLWGAILWREFENPFFPMFNTWFKSPWWEPIDFLDRNWGPRDAFQAFFFPLLVNADPILTAELPFRDYRIAALYLLALACAAKRLGRRARGAQGPEWPAGLAAAAKTTGVFALVSYLAWLKVYGIYRYILPLELASGPLMVACVLYLLADVRWRVLALAALAVTLVATTQRTDWGRLKFGDRYFEVDAPALPANALVLMGRWEPMSYIIAFFRADARFVAPVNLLLDIGQSNLLARRAAEVIASHEGPIYSLDFAIHHARTDSDLARLGLVRVVESCEVVKSTFDESAMRLCRVERRQPRAAVR